MNAVELLNEYTRRVSSGDVDGAFDLFADDAAFEFPYFPSVGIGGRVGASRPFADKLEAFSSIELRISNLTTSKYLRPILRSVLWRVFRIHQDQSNGPHLSPALWGRLESANGKIVLLREFSNPVEAAVAIFPGGLADVLAKLNENSAQ